MVSTDLKRWPLVVTTLSGIVSLDDTERLAKAHMDLLERRELHASVFDATRVSAVPDAVVRKRMGDFVTESAELSLVSTVCSGLVIPSAILRGALTAIHWIGRPVVPVRSFETRAEAVSWCIEELVARGLQIPIVDAG